MGTKRKPKPKSAKRVNSEYFNSEEKRVLVISDIHAPYDLDGYLDFVVQTYKRYNCNEVVFIGDVIDSHYTSYHETSTAALGAGDELSYAIERLARYYKEFPEATVLWGNHDRLVMRKAQTGGIPAEWIKDISEVLEVPNWNFMHDYYLDGVRYTHGDASGQAKTAMMRDGISTVCGHFHTQFYVQYQVGINQRIFGMQVGCGIDDEAKAFSYAKGGKKSAIGCGVVIGGKTAIAVPMELGQTKYNTDK